MALEPILAIATLLGGGAAIWFFVDKARTIQWRRPHFERAPPIARVPVENYEGGQPPGRWPVLRPDPAFPLEVKDAVANLEPNFHLPVGDDIRSDWAVYGDPDTLFPFFCKGSFTGRNRREYALFLKARSGHGYKVVALVRSGSGGLSSVDLLEGQDEPYTMFVRTIPPGRYRPGMSARELGSPDKVRVRHDGINLGTFESADCIFFWDGSTRSFRQVWMSD